MSTTRHVYDNDVLRASLPRRGGNHKLYLQALRHHTMFVDRLASSSRSPHRGAMFDSPAPCLAHLPQCGIAELNSAPLASF